MLSDNQGGLVVQLNEIKPDTHCAPAGLHPDESERSKPREVGETKRPLQR